MKVTNEMINYVLSGSPHARGDNTELYIAFIDTVLKHRGHQPLSLEVKEAMRDYKPESVTRKRREVIEPTKEQREKEQEYRHDYSHYVQP